MAKRSDIPNYDPDYHPIHAKKFCMLGATNADLGRMFDIAESTFEAWMRKHPELRREVLKGRELADADVAHALYRRAKGYRHRATKIMQYQGEVITEDYTEHYPPDTGAITLWLTNRQPDKWKVKNSTEHTGPAGGPMVIEKIQRVIVDPKA